MKHSKWYILLSVLALSLIMSLVDGILQPPYIVKSAIKLGLFLLVALVFFRKDPAQRSILKTLFAPRLKPMVLGAVLGLAAFGILLGAYLLLQDHLDFSGITANLESTAGVTADNFLYVSLYIAFCNSLLEEFLFRGFGYVALKQFVSPLPAALFSSFCFAFYHIGMTLGWVHPGLFLLELVGLMAGGLIFNWLDHPSGSIYPSWLTHMGCNFGINTIGFLLFGLI